MLNTTEVENGINPIWCFHCCGSSDRLRGTNAWTMISLNVGELRSGQVKEAQRCFNILTQYSQRFTREKRLLACLRAALLTPMRHFAAPDNVQLCKHRLLRWLIRSCTLELNIKVQ